jgi:hypothetical protein
MHSKNGINLSTSKNIAGRMLLIKKYTDFGFSVLTNICKFIISK